MNWWIRWLGFWFLRTLKTVYDQTHQYGYGDQDGARVRMWDRSNQQVYSQAYSQNKHPENDFEGIIPLLVRCSIVHVEQSMQNFIQAQKCSEHERRDQSSYLLNIHRIDIIERACKSHQIMLISYLQRKIRKIHNSWHTAVTERLYLRSNQ